MNRIINTGHFLTESKTMKIEKPQKNYETNVGSVREISLVLYSNRANE